MSFKFWYSDKRQCGSHLRAAARLMLFASMRAPPLWWQMPELGRCRRRLCEMLGDDDSC